MSTKFETKTKQNFIKMKKSILAILAITAMTFTSCSDDNNDVDKDSFELKVDDLKGNITEGTVTLDASKTYTLTGALVVKSGATLTIPAGTTIKSSATVDATAMYIAVEQNATININGTSGNPVVMTSGKSSPAQSDWGGLVICGNGKVNTGTPGTSEVGALTYGGNDNADSSGSITYLKIAYTGARFTADKEFNGISFFAVGSGTTVDYIYALESGDDAVEFFGGAVEAKHLVLINSYDDSLDFADGFSGSFTDVYINGVTNAGVEGSNNGNNGAATPITNATITNLSVIKGTDAKFIAKENVINFKEGGGYQAYTNVYSSGIPVVFKSKGEDTAAQAIITAGLKFTINGYQFEGATDMTAGATLSGATTATGAGNGAAVPTWATTAFGSITLN